MLRELRKTVKSGGAAFGYTEGDKILALASVGSTFFGVSSKYLQLELLLVTNELRGKGIGRLLLEKSADFARTLGAEKLYISGHSCVETQAFYKAMGCVHTVELNSELFYREPFDVHLEYAL